MKTVTETFDYTVRIQHVGPDWICTGAVRELEDGSRIEVDLALDGNLRLALELDQDCRIGPASLSGETLGEFLSNGFWAATHVVDKNEGNEVIDASFTFTESKPLACTEIRIDLKWSLWSADVGTFEEHVSEEGLALMRQAFEGTGKPVLVRTAPDKEIRFGSVLIERGEMTYEFSCEWDDSRDLITEELDLSDELAESLAADITDWLRDMAQAVEAPFSTENIGAFIQGSVTADDFETALHKVDEAEERLLKIEKENSAALDLYIQGCLS